MEPRDNLSAARYIYMHIQGAISARLCVASYAKSNVLGAKLCVKRYAEKASNQADHIICQHKILYRTDKDGNRYRTWQDEVVEVLTEEQHNTLIPLWESVMLGGIFPCRL